MNAADTTPSPLGYLKQDQIDKVGDLVRHQIYLRTVPVSTGRVRLNQYYSEQRLYQI